MAYFVVQVLTVARVPLAIGMAVLLLATGERVAGEPYLIAHSPWVLVACIVLQGLADLTDILDGYFARRWGAVSEAGATLDPLADSLSRIITYWALACAGLAWATVPLVMALRDVLAAYCRIVWVRRGSSVSARWSGKLKAVVQGAGAFALLAGPLYWPYVGKWPLGAISLIVIVATLLSAAEYVVHAVRLSRPARTS
jgi:CDP-diacylglycerol--glycerol-3-phosphate 3-phosphatidyltransferase